MRIVCWMMISRFGCMRIVVQHDWLIITFRLRCCMRRMRCFRNEVCVDHAEPRSVDGVSMRVCGCGCGREMDGCCSCGLTRSLVILIEPDDGLGAVVVMFSLIQISQHLPLVAAHVRVEVEFGCVHVGRRVRMSRLGRDCSSGRLTRSLSRSRGSHPFSLHQFGCCAHAKDGLLSFVGEFALVAHRHAQRVLSTRDRQRSEQNLSAAEQHGEMG